MATLSDYKGSVSLIAGLKPASDGYPLLEAHDIQVAVSGIRLDAKLTSLDQTIDTLATKNDLQSLKTEIIGSLAQDDSLAESFDSIKEISDFLAEHDESIGALASLITDVGTASSSNPSKPATGLHADVETLEDYVDELRTINGTNVSKSKIGSANAGNGQVYLNGTLTTIYDDTALVSKVGSISDAADPTGTTAWSRIINAETDIDNIEAAIGTDSTSGTIKGRIKTLEDEIGGTGSANSISSRVRTLENNVGSTQNQPDASGTTLWSRLRNAEVDVDSLEATLGKATATPSAVGTSAWSRLKNAESDIDTLEATLGRSSSIASPDGTSAWSRLKNAEADIDNIEETLGMSDSTPGGGSIITRISNMESDIDTIETAIGISSAAPSGGSVLSRVETLETSVSELISSVGESTDSASALSTSAWGRIKNNENNISTIGASINTLSNNISTINTNTDVKISLIRSILGDANSAANASGASAWSRIRALQTQLSGISAGFVVLNLSSYSSALSNQIDSCRTSGKIIIVAGNSISSTYNNIGFTQVGSWYYYNNTQWVNGGTVAGIVVDALLTQNGAAADAKVTGDAIERVNGKITSLRDDLTDNKVINSEEVLYYLNTNTFSETYKDKNHSNSQVNNSVAIDITKNGDVYTINSNNYLTYENSFVISNNNPSQDPIAQRPVSTSADIDISGDVFTAGAVYELKVDILDGNITYNTNQTEYYPLSVAIRENYSDGSNNTSNNILIRDFAPDDVTTTHSRETDNLVSKRFIARRINDNTSIESISYTIEVILPRYARFYDFKFSVRLEKYDNLEYTKFKDKIESGLICKNLVDSSNISTYFPVDIRKNDVITISTSDNIPLSATRSIELYSANKTLVDIISFPVDHNYYGLDKSYLRYVSANNEPIKYIKIPTNVEKLLQIEYGANRTNYVPYFVSIQDIISSISNDIENLSADVDAEIERVMEAINNVTINKDDLGLYQDKDTLIVYPTYRDEASENGIPLSGIGGGGSGGSGSGGGDAITATLTASNTTGWLSKTIHEGDDCYVSLTWSSIDDDLPTGDGVITIKKGTATLTSYQVPQGEVTVNLAPYLVTGGNSITVRISDIYNQGKSYTFNVNSAELTISSTIDTSNAYTSAFTLPFTIVGPAMDKTVYFFVDGESVGTLETKATNKQLSYNIPAQSHGSHSLTAYFECTINNETVRSNELYLEFIFIDNNSPNTIITSPFNTTTLEQYNLISIPFRVYKPNSATAEIEIYRNDTLVSEQTVDRTEQNFTYRAINYGTDTIRIESGGITKTFTITITKSDIEIAAETEDLVLYLTASGRSNGETTTREEWTNNSITTTFSNFNWVRDGWLTDDNGYPILRFEGDSRATINYQIFGSDFKNTGKTIEFEFATRQVSDYTATVLSCFADNIGFRITPQYVIFKGAQTSITVPYKDNEHIRVSIVVDKQQSGYRKITVYINGIASSAAQYIDGERFSQLNPVNISIGSNDCGIDIYNIRIYDNDLTNRQIVNNLTADTSDITEMLDRYTRNNIYDEYDQVSMDKLPASLPRMIIEAEEMPQFKGDKKTVSVRYLDQLYPSNSFTASGVEIDVQGTSSSVYFRKNTDMKFKNGFTMNNGNTTSTYALRPGSIPFNRFVLKADVASSEGANNTELTMFYNDTCIYKTPEMVANSAVRWGIEGIPIVLFWYNTSTGKYTFLGKQNFNLPKRCPAPLGYSGDSQSWEVERNNSANVKFQNNDFDTEAYNDEKMTYYPEWYDDFEARFPEDTYRDYSMLKEFITWVKSTWREAATGENLESPVEFKFNTTTTVDAYTSDNSYTVEDEYKNGNKTGYKIFTFTKDTPAYRLSKFRAEAPGYIEMSSAYFYWLFTELFLMIDSRAKNMFLGFHGSPCTVDGSHIDRKVVFEPYDMDTAIGTNNSGVLMFNYDLEDTDTVSEVITGSGEGNSNAPVFNAQDSVLWCNIRDAFKPEIASTYVSLRTGNNAAWSYQTIEDRYKAHQSKWSEAIYNEDAYTKYLIPLIEPVTYDEDTKQYIKTARYLTMMQGSKSEQRKWWLYNRFRYMDSKYNTGDAASRTIDLRLFGAGTLNITTAINMYVAVRFGGGSAAQIRRVEAGTPESFAYVPETGITEMETWIYSADLITDLGDLSVFYPNELNFSRATRLKRLKIGDSSPSYSNNNLRTIDVQNCVLLEEIDCRNCGNLAIAINLENSPRIKEAYFDGTSVTSVNLADGGIIETLHLPDTITSLTLFNLNNLEDLTIAGYDNISTLMIANISDEILDPVETLNAIQANSLVYIEGLYLELANAAAIEEFLDLLDTFKGVTREKNAAGNWIYHEHNDAQVIGEIHTNALTGEQLEDYNSRYPYLRFTATNIETKLTYKNHDGTSIIKEVSCYNGVPQSGAPSNPSRAATAQYTYTFVGWSTAMNSSTATPNYNTNVTQNRTVYAAYSSVVNKYTVTWKDADGTTLETDTNVPYGNTPTYNGTTPHYNSQTFVTWTPTISTVTGNITYTASYTPRYTVTWYNDDNTTVLYQITVNKGSNATYAGTNPPVSTNGNDYIFLGWDKATTNVQANLSVYAQFKAPKAFYTPGFDVTGTYAVQWDYTDSEPTLSRGGLAASFADPTPATSTSGSGSSPFDNIAPWKDMKMYNVGANGISYSQSDSGFSTSNDTVVYIPEFYYKSEKDTTHNRWTWAISPTAKTGYTLHPGSGKYIGRYHTSGSSSAVYTKSGVAPLNNTSQTNFRTYSSAKGTGWRMLDLATWSALQLLYLVEFANFNSQETLGKGYIPGSFTGTMGGTDGATYHTIKAGTSSDKNKHNQYRYVEDPFSFVYDWVDGFLGSKDASKGIYTAALSSYNGQQSQLTKLNFALPNGSYIKNFGYDENAAWAFIPNESGSPASASTYVTDYVYSNSSLYPVNVGGGYYDYVSNGLFYFDAYNSASNTFGNLGSRLLYTG